MGNHCIGYMDNFLGNCYVNSRVQQPIKSYRMFSSLSCLSVLSVSLTSAIYTCRLLFSEAGLAVSRRPNCPIYFTHTNISSVGLPAIFWFVMNKGRWFSSPRKIILAISNVIILGIGIAIVRFRYPY